MSLIAGWMLFASLLLQVFSPSDGGARPVLIDDFEQSRVAGNPLGWKQIERRSTLVPVPPDPVRDDDYFEVVQEQGNRFARVYTKGETTMLVQVNGEGYRWNLKSHPRLGWRWRALQLPEGAREDKDHLNDAGAALYVAMTRGGLFNRPDIIKYTYSSTLPVGTVVSYGSLKVLVVSSGADGLKRWVGVDRDVAADYRMLFGKEPPNEPFSVGMWSDSDNTGSTALVDFDDIRLLPARSR